MAQVTVLQEHMPLCNALINQCISLEELGEKCVALEPWHITVQIPCRTNWGSKCFQRCTMTLWTSSATTVGWSNTFVATHILHTESSSRWPSWSIHKYPGIDFPIWVHSSGTKMLVQCYEELCGSCLPWWGTTVFQSQFRRLAAMASLWPMWIRMRPVDIDPCSTSSSAQKKRGFHRMQGYPGRKPQTLSPKYYYVASNWVEFCGTL